MTYLIAAFATDNGKTFMGRHFGDAHKYLIYKISKGKVELLKEIINTTDDDETIHADPRKAGSIAKLLKQENVQIVVSKIFGPNIRRIKKKFVCILSKRQNISKAISDLQNNFSEILFEWEKGEKRNYLKI